MLSVVEGIVAAAKANGATPALITGNRTITYFELKDTVARISNHLAGRGLKPRAKLFLNIADPDLRLITMVAAMHCGLIPFALLEVGDLGSEVDYDYVIGAALLQVPHLVPDLVIDQSVLEGRLSDPALREFPDQPDDAILYIGSTSGTTGRRKMVAETWGSFARRTAPGTATPAAPPPVGGSIGFFAASDRVLTTMGDVTYAGVAIALSLLVNGSVNVRPSRDAVETAKIINLAGVTRMTATPATLGQLMDAMEAQGLRCPSVKRITLGGSLFEQALIARIEKNFTAEIRVGYGASEVGLISAATVTSATYKPGYVGQPAQGVKLVTVGTPDEPAPLVIVRDPGTMLPYYSNGKAVPNTETFYTLPDIGYAVDGSLYIVGRDDEVYNFNGNKVAFSLIDGDLRTMPDVRDVAVVSARPIGDALGLVIGVVGPAEAGLPALRNRVLQRLKNNAGDHIRVFRLAQVPRNAMGKVDRQRVLAAYEAQSEEVPLRMAANG